MFAYRTKGTRLLRFKKKKKKLCFSLEMMDAIDLNACFNSEQREDKDNYTGHIQYGTKQIMCAIAINIHT